MAGTTCPQLSHKVVIPSLIPRAPTLLKEGSPWNSCISNLELMTLVKFPYLILVFLYESVSGSKVVVWVGR